VVAPDPARVVALRVRKTPGEADILLWTGLTAFGRDAVTVPSADAFVTPDPEIAILADKHHDVLGHRVLDASGRELGTVKDVDFDLESGAVTSVITDRTEIPGEAVIGLGSYALVVRAAS
jgi:uncharacterized protein YrrD